MLFRMIDGLNINSVIAIVSVAIAKLCMLPSLLSDDCVDVATLPVSKWITRTIFR